MCQLILTTEVKKAGKVYVWLCTHLKKACACLWHQKKSVKPGKQDFGISYNGFLNNFYLSVIIENN